MANILLADDDEQYRIALKNLLTEADHLVTEALDGLNAQKILEAQSFDLVITDIRMPNCDGLQLLNWVKLHQPNLPVILITGFSEILESTQAAEKGASGFLAKPFKFQEVQNIINNVAHGSKKSQDLEDVDDQFSRVPLENFITGSRINFSIYHRISSNQYLKIAHRGENISEARLNTYKAKGLKHLFLTKADYADYVGFRIVSAPLADKKRKFDFTKMTSQLIRDNLFLTGLAKEDFDIAQDVTETTVSLAIESQDVLALLEVLSKHSDFLYAHSLGVSLYSVMIAHKMGWQWAPALFKVSLSGLLHDAGFKELAIETINTGRFAINIEDRRLFESHTSRGMEVLNQIPSLPDDVMLVAYQHHEEAFGQGYPQQLPRVRTHPISRLVNLADAFCELVLPWPGSPKLSVEEAFKELKEKKNNYDREGFIALEFLLNPQHQTLSK